MRLLLVLALAGCAAVPHGQSDWEEQNTRRQWNEESLVMPPAPAQASLLEFAVPDAGGFRFFVDGATLSSGKDGVVRYVLVAHSPSGAQNVSFEGLSCATAEHRVYALGRSDGSWAASRGEWRSLTAPSVQRRQVTLYREYFCPQNEPIRTAAEGVRALQQGGHPFARGFSGEGGRGR